MAIQRRQNWSKDNFFQISDFWREALALGGAIAAILNVVPQLFRFPLFILCSSLGLWFLVNKLAEVRQAGIASLDGTPNLKVPAKRRFYLKARWLNPIIFGATLGLYISPTTAGVFQDSPPAYSLSVLPQNSPSSNLLISTPTKIPTITPNPSQAALATYVSTPNPSFSGQQRIIDGVAQVFVPAGYFIAGDLYADGFGYDDEMLHLVYTDEFWIDQYLVTNEQFAACPEEICGEPDLLGSHKREHYFGTTTYADYPVIEVIWDQAVAYCDWRGGRLPTEAEWEKAASWNPKTGETLLYPWGNEPPNENLANFNGIDRDTTEVTSYPAGASPVGAYDMAGNVWQWVMDWYSSTYYSDNQDWINPTGPSDGVKKVVRGGSWHTASKDDGEIIWLRTANRGTQPPSEPGNEFGFRCVYGASQLP